MIQDQVTTKFFGLATQPEPQSVKDGVVTDGLNWMFAGGDKKNGADKVELRRGYDLLGVDAGVGKVTGLGVGLHVDSSETLFRTRARKIEYYVDSSDTWSEVGTDSLPSGASGEDISIEPYTSLAGYAIYFSSPNSSIYKIMVANPSTLIDMSSTSFRGRIKIKDNRMLLWNRLGTNKQKDNTGLYGSKLDKDSYADYTTVTAEAIGSSGSQTYSGTLAFKSGGAKRSCFAVTFTDGTETFVDNYDGGLTGTLGGTGTINYASGAYSITFNSVAAGSVTATYQWEDPTSGGVADFTAPSSPRVATESFIIRQDEGGGTLGNIGSYDGSYYCFHEKKTWKLTISADDTDASNLPYRSKVGIENWRGMADTADGVYYVDTSSESASDVRIKKLSLENISTNVIPYSISDLILLEDYRFDYAVLKEWGDFIVLSCRTSDSSQNNRLFLYDRRLNLWNPPHDIQAYTLAVYNGALVGGDSTTNNVYELYSGLSDDDSNITNYVTFNISNYGVEGLKKTKRFITEGEIQEDQILQVYASFDRGDFVLVDTIYGNGEYVDIGSDIAVGKNTIGKNTLGTGDVVLANHYKKETKINTDVFNQVQFKFVATQLGYVSVTMYASKDIRYKGRKVVSKYIA
jgi:hypothetical protein